MRPYTIVNVGYRSTNFWVVTAGPVRLLVDLGWPGMLGALRAELTRKGIAVAEITHGFATHYHPDHAGLAQELKHSGMQLLITPEQVRTAPEMTRWTKPEEHFVPIRTDDARTRIVSIVESRSVLHDLGIDGEFVHTPGHSDDSVSLLLDDGVVFTGDLTPPGSAEEDHLALVTQSWAALKGRGARRVYPGHGPVRNLEG